MLCARADNRNEIGFLWSGNRERLFNLSHAPEFIIRFIYYQQQQQQQASELRVLSFNSFALQRANTMGNDFRIFPAS
jgi:hypothetical protein